MTRNRLMLVMVWVAVLIGIIACDSTAIQDTNGPDANGDGDGVILSSRKGGSTGEGNPDNLTVGFGMIQLGSNALVQWTSAEFTLGSLFLSEPDPCDFETGQWFDVPRGELDLKFSPDARYLSFDPDPQSLCALDLVLSGEAVHLKGRTQEGNTVHLYLSELPRLAFSGARLSLPEAGGHWLAVLQAGLVLDERLLNKLPQDANGTYRLDADSDESLKREVMEALVSSLVLLEDINNNRQVDPAELDANNILAMGDIDRSLAGWGQPADGDEPTDGDGVILIDGDGVDECLTGIEVDFFEGTIRNHDDVRPILIYSDTPDQINVSYELNDPDDVFYLCTPEECDIDWDLSDQPRFAEMMWLRFRGLDTFEHNATLTVRNNACPEQTFTYSVRGLMSESFHVLRIYPEQPIPMEAEVGESISADFWVYNPESDSITVHSIFEPESDDAGFWFGDNQSAQSEFVVGPYSAKLFPIVFRPTKAGLSSAVFSVRIAGDPPEIGYLTVRIQGYGKVRDAVQLSDSNLAFGPAKLGTLTTRTLTITNNGESNFATVGIWKDSELYYTEGFRIVEIGGLEGLTPGESGTVTFEYASRDFPHIRYRESPEMDLYTIDVEFSDGATVSADVSLMGIAMRCEPRVTVIEPTYDGGTYNYGQVGVGQRLERTIKIENRGTRVCNLQDVYVAEGADDGFSVQSVSAAIDPGQSIQIPFYLEPTAVKAELSGRIVLDFEDRYDFDLMHHDSEVPVYELLDDPEIELEATMATACLIDIEPESSEEQPIQLSAYKDECSEPVEVQITNNSEFGVTLDSMSGQGGVDGSWQISLPEGVSFPFVLAPGDDNALSVEIVFCPGGTTFRQQFLLKFPIEDELCVDPEIYLTGEGEDCPEGYYDHNPNIPGCEYLCPTPQEALLTVEKCDGWDNDCDGETDEGFNLGESCMGIGICGAGQLVCKDDWSLICSSMLGDPPGEPEVCNGLDDDCDGETDEDWAIGYQCDGEGECGPGARECGGPDSAICSSDPGGSTFQGRQEVCDGKDNDCDGGTDEDFFIGIECDGVGECGQGHFQCDPNSVYHTICSTDIGGCCYDGTAEICDGKDNDCDGSTDEDFGVGVPCYGMGECGLGVQECDPDNLMAAICSTNPGGSADRSRDEVCDGKDNDCDGSTDENFMIGVTCVAPGVCGQGEIECKPGAAADVQCSSGPGGSHYAGYAELCNGLDDDCDGYTDEDFFMLGQPCEGTLPDHCEQPVYVCAPDGRSVICNVIWPGPVGDPELCDNIDNDCDGETDEDFFVGYPCDGVGECGIGVIECDPTTNGLTAICSTDILGSNYEGAPELCDGRDNDCDGETDEDFGIGDDCDGEGECGLGVIRCYNLTVAVCSSELGSDYDGEPELCDGRDNDCDGQTDENFRVGSPCEGIGECGPGVRMCDGLDHSSCSTDPGMPNYDGSPEICDGKDNDCDGEIDEGLLPSDCGLD